MTVFDPLISVYFGMDETTRVRVDRDELRSISKLMSEHCTPHDNTTAALRTALSIEAIADDFDDTDESKFKINPAELQIKSEGLVQDCISKQCCKAKLNDSHCTHQCKWIDTHSGPHKTVCVSLNDEFKTGIYFQAKPDAVSCILPMYLDIKSSQSRKEESKSRLIDDDFELLHQGVERLFQVIQFRAYLSKFIVMLSNGCHSFVLLYQHHITNRQHSFSSFIVPIPTVEFDLLVRQIMRVAAEVGPSYYLTDHGPLILNAINKLVNQNDLYRCRVQFLTCSTRSTYFVTKPIDNRVDTSFGNKSFVMKINFDLDNFKKEVEILEELSSSSSSSVFDLERLRRFFGIYTSSKRVSNFVKAFEFEEQESSKCSSKVWFHNLPPTVKAGGVLVTKAGVRSHYFVPNDFRGEGIIKEQLSKQLAFIHKKNILHTDIRPPNIVFFFKRGWQLIDFDCAEKLTESTRTAITKVQKNSSRYEYSSRRVKQLGNSVEESNWYDVLDYSEEDDREMLDNAIKSILMEFNPFTYNLRDFDSPSDTKEDV